MNLGFVAETERQVVAHLDDHLTVLPEADQRSREVIAQMRDDEAEHAKMAVSRWRFTTPNTSSRGDASGIQDNDAHSVLVIRR